MYACPDGVSISSHWPGTRRYSKSADIYVQGIPVTATGSEIRPLASCQCLLLDQELLEDRAGVMLIFVTPAHVTDYRCLDG